MNEKQNEKKTKIYAEGKRTAKRKLTRKNLEGSSENKKEKKWKIPKINEDKKEKEKKMSDQSLRKNIPENLKIINM